MPCAIINIDQPAQMRGQFGVQHHAVMPEPQNRKHRAANLDPQARLATLLRFAGQFQTLADLF